MFDFILSHPLYIPFIALNIFIIYKVIQDVKRDENDDRDDEDDSGGWQIGDDPDLDLPPGVSLPVNTPETTEA
jgi:hypothetical protein